MLSLYVVPTICEPLTEQPISDCVQAHTRLLGLELADSSNPTSGLLVDLLVGADYYWKLVMGNTCTYTTEKKRDREKREWGERKGEMILCAYRAGRKNLSTLQ